MFRWHIVHDLDLLVEVLGVRPSSPTDWNMVAENLSNAWKLEVPITGRSSKEHFDLLLRHHKDGNAAALKK